MRRDLNLLKFKDISVSSNSNQKMGMVLFVIFAIAVVGLTGFAYFTTSTSLNKATKEMQEAQIIKDQTKPKNKTTEINRLKGEIEAKKGEKTNFELLIALFQTSEHSININSFQYFVLNPEKAFQQKLGIVYDKNILLHPFDEDLRKEKQSKDESGNWRDKVPDPNKDPLYYSYIVQSDSHKEIINMTTGEYEFGAEFQIGGIYFGDEVITPQSIDEDSKDFAWKIYNEYLNKLLKKGIDNYGLKISDRSVYVVSTGEGDDYKLAIKGNVKITIPLSNYVEFSNLFNNLNSTNLNEILE